MADFDLDRWHMARALELAQRGRGAVEPNPLVGCIVARGAETIGEGWHRRYGGPHAEIEALAVAGSRAAGATLYVTLEPCCHFGKTPPCTDALIAAQIARVVVALRDPFPAVDGGGIARLASAGIAVEMGVMEDEARCSNAPYLKLLSAGRPWILAKWAMSLDGKLATRTLDSRWISGTRSRQVAHQLRGRVDAVIVGRGTALADDPLLTARPPGARIATRIVLDSRALLASSSRLVETVAEAPVLVACGSQAPLEHLARLEALGCQVLVCPDANGRVSLNDLLGELGRRRMTNVLVEGGGQVLGGFFDAGLVDEVHAFIAPRLIGGSQAPGPVGGHGIEQLSAALHLTQLQIETLDGDLYVHGLTARGQAGAATI
jgi:diaminohydroxyphosphoribosylaminopyrimidine deaminase/5-amino-6-(5-phosphoribosylamino)uracil reductase